jgi:hypothetical protein
MKLGAPWSVMVGLLILTGAPMEDIRKIRGCDIDWTLSRWTPKHRNSHEGLSLSKEVIRLLEPYRNEGGYLFQSTAPRRKTKFLLDDSSGERPVNLYTEILEQLRDSCRISWKWGVRDIRHAVQVEVHRLDARHNGLSLWSEKFVAKRDEDEVTL